MHQALNRVAIIDDDASVARALGRLLRSVGFAAVEFQSAEAFLSEACERRFCCLLVDIHLGGMSGLEIPHQLVARGDTTPVIFITAHDDAALPSKAIQYGGARFFRKTDSFEPLIEALRELGCVAQAGAQRPKPAR